MSVTHIAGAGVAGLAAAVRLAGRGARVVVHEAAPAPGGRCRSFHDAALGCMIDNGNHLILTGNTAVRAYLAETGAEGGLVAAEDASFPFVDLRTEARWTVAMGRGVLPLWALDAACRPPGVSARDLLAAGRLMLASRDKTLAQAIRTRGFAWTRFWDPLTRAVLNAPPERASARLLCGALARSFALGGRACRPMFAPMGLGAALVEPALAFLARHGGTLRTRSALRAIGTRDGRATALVFDGDETVLGPGDQVILALPPGRLKALLPGLDPPEETGVILNAHLRLPPGAADQAPPLLGVLSGETQWLFRRGDVISATISAAETSPLLALSREAALETLWAEAQRALRLPQTAPLAARLLKEKRATFDQSPAGVARRLPMRMGLANVLLAGDHIRTGLPATLEGAVRSGQRAAEAALRPAAWPARRGQRLAPEPA